VARIRYRLSEAEWGELVERLAQMKYRGALVGRDGAGKSTLLQDIKEYFDRQGRAHKMVFVSEDIAVGWKQIKEVLESKPQKAIMLVDGADHLSKICWIRLKRWVIRNDMGLIITSHHQGMLDTLMECRTTVELLKEIVGEFMKESEPVADEILEQLYRKHDGNVRDALRELYDLFSHK